MTTVNRYAEPVEGTEWFVPETFESCFKWEYEDGSESLLDSTRRARSCNGTPAAVSIGRTISIRKIREGCRTSMLPIFGSPVWERMNAKERADLGAIRRPITFAVSARRAGRAHLHREDRPAGARYRRQVLRRDAGDG